MIGDNNIEDITVVLLSIARPNAATTLATINRTQ